MNILMLVDDLNIGGTGTHILNISKALIKKGFSITVISKDGKLKDIFQENSIEVINLDIFDDINNVCMEIIKIYNLKSIDLIHAHLPQSIKVASFLKSLHNIDYVSSLHGLFYDRHTIDLCENANGVICVSEPIKNMFIEYLPTFPLANISLIYNTISSDISISEDIRDSLSIDKNIKIITYCSRLNSSKGILAEQFLHEFYKLSKKHKNVNALILGNGSRKRHLDFYANMINSESNKKIVYVLGDVYNPCDYFFASSCVVGTGRVLIEALSCNTSCIALGSKGYGGLVEPDSYNNMLYTYFSEHDSISKPLYTFEKSLDIALDDTISRDIISKNTYWSNRIFNDDSSTNKLIYFYKKAIL